MLKSIIKPTLRVASVPGRLLAGLWARPGYFHERDLKRLGAGKIALVACHWLGDTFWASQVVPALARRFPHSLIYAITKSHSIDLWAGLVSPERVIRGDEVLSDRHRERKAYPG